MTTAGEERARALTRALAAGQFAEVTASFDETLRAALPAAKLAEAWRGLESAAGPFAGVASSRSEASGAYEVAVLSAHFGKTALDLRWAFDAERRVAGFVIVPTPPPWAPPDYVKEGALASRELSLKSGDVALGATLTAPKDGPARAAVILVHGSGPNDRDETIGGAKPFRDLAEGLATRGVAALRWEKRTRAYAARYKDDPAAFAALTLDEETVDDAVAALALLRATPGLERVPLAVVGHSLGAVAAPRIAERAPAAAKPSALVLLAPSARPLPDLMVEQLEHIASLDARRAPEERAQIDAIKKSAARAKAVAAGAPAEANEVILGASPAYWRALAAYDPLATAKRLALPTLVLRGARDYQVAHADFALWQGALAGRPDAALRELPRLNHLFVAGDGPSGPDEYALPGHVEAAVVEAIAAFVAP